MCVSPIHHRSYGQVQRDHCAVEVNDAEDHISIHCRLGEAEYYAASEMAIEVIYLRNLNLLESMVPQAPDTPLADVFTNALPFQQFISCVRGILEHSNVHGSTPSLRLSAGPGDSGAGGLCPQCQLCLRRLSHVGPWRGVC